MLTSTQKKIYLTSIEHENLETIRIARNDPLNRQYFREYREISKTAQEEWFKKNLQDTSQINFEIHNFKTGELVGTCSFNHIKMINLTAEFGILIFAEHQNKGYGKDALHTLLSYGFQDLNLHKIWAEVYSNNDNALEMYKKCGFEVEGKLKKHIYKNGNYIDLNIIGLLKEDWLKL